MDIIISPYSNKLRNDKENPKNYPFWPELIKLLQDDGHVITQIGTPAEKVLVENTKFGLSFKDLKVLVDQSDLFFSVDNFFPHFCHHYGKHGIVLFSRSNPEIFGYPENLNLLKDIKYLRPDQFGWWESCEYLEHAFLGPEKVMEAIKIITTTIK